MKISFFAFIIAFLVTPARTNGQKVVVHNNQQWFQYYNQIPLSKKITLFSDISVRQKDCLSELSQLTLRCGIGYSFIQKLKGISGYANFLSFQSNEFSRIEHRFYQEVSNTTRLSHLFVQNRFRIEYRLFIPLRDDKVTRLINSNFRFRYRLYFTTKGIKLFGVNSPREINFNLGNEIFINAGKNMENRIIDNNRILIGPGFQFNKEFSVSLLYNYQYAKRDSYIYERSDILWLGVFHKLPLQSR